MGTGSQRLVASPALGRSGHSVIGKSHAQFGDFRWLPRPMQVSSCLNRFVTEIYATLVGVLFLEDLVSQVAKGSVRYVIAPVKDVLLLLLLAMAVPKIKVVPRPVLYAVGFIYALVGLAALRAPSLTAAVLGFRDVYWGLLLLLATIVLATQRALVGLFWAIILMGNIGAIIAVATHSLGMWWVDAVVRSGGRIASNYFTTGGYGNPRAFSPFQEPNVLGAAMVVVILTALLRPIPVTKVVWAATPLPLVALLMSKSRSAVLGLILGLAVWGLTSDRTRRVVGNKSLLPWFLGLGSAFLAASIAVGFHYAATTSDPSARFHLKTLLSGPRLVLDNPFGLGLGRVGPRAVIAFPGATQVESGLLIISLEIGILGLLAFLYLLSILGVRFAKEASSQSKDQRSIARWALTVLLAAGPTILLLAMIQSSSLVWLWWLIWGSACGAVLTSSGESRSSDLVDGQVADT
jgi:putative inorganic carbon (HCO3(-)) transporter